MEDHSKQARKTIGDVERENREATRKGKEYDAGVVRRQEGGFKTPTKRRAQRVQARQGRR